MMWQGFPRLSRRGAAHALGGTAVALAALFALTLCGAGAEGADVVTLVFTYGSEKEEWIKDLTAKFNADPAQTVAGGRRIRVEAVPLGSGESIEELLAGRSPKGQKSPAHLTSPASAAFIKIGNAESRAQGKGDLVGPTKNLVRSPVVIAMWKPMAEALGWPGKPVGWSDVLQLAQDEQAWEKRDHAEWDPFRFGHTHPELSNSGLISIFAEVYAAPSVQKDHGLTVADVTDPRTARFLRGIEQSVVYYGSSTGFFARKMFTGGPRYLSAAVMYENMVIESYDRKKYKPQFPVVAVYPKEGTFMSDHPVGVVRRDWVKAEHQEAAQKYIAYLLGEEQQKAAMAYGFRPGLEKIDLQAPLDRAHGVDPAQPTRQLQVPAPEVIQAIRDLWQKNRKQTSIILVLDTSGSMADNDRLTNAKIGARSFVSKIGGRDFFSVIPFSTAVAPARGQLRMTQDRRAADDFIDRLIPKGETALFDAVQAGYDLTQGADHKQLIPAVIVLTDGMNNRSKDKADTLTAEENERALAKLLERIKPGPEKRPARIFTIGYALDAKKEEEAAALKALKQIAETSEGKFYEGTPENIEEIFREIRKFF
jgi:Ca-activated chloride channel family protein